VASELWVRPDIVFTRARIAVFVDGCFWHSCPLHGRAPKSNVAYWTPKLEANRARDVRVDTALASEGWAVVRIWEHENVDAAADVVVREFGWRS
jgi:DNA mismatch endonuclease (patch repair protein)